MAFRLVDLHKAKAFRKRFADKLSECESQREAYRKVEQEYESIFGEQKYSSFASFLASYYRAKSKS